MYSIFTYKTGPFVGFLCRDSYSSTMVRIWVSSWYLNIYWLVVTGTLEFYDFPIILGMECHDPNWRTHTKSYGTVAMDFPWLVVSTPLKNISQNGNDSPIYIYIYPYLMENKIHVWNHQPELYSQIYSGWWYTYPSEKWWSSSVGMMTFPIYGKNIFMFHKPNISPL